MVVKQVDKLSKAGQQLSLRGIHILSTISCIHQTHTNLSKELLRLLRSWVYPATTHKDSFLSLTQLMT